MTVTKYFPPLSCLDQYQMTTAADTTTMIIVSICPRCGTISKSGKMSCCGRGGSWFNICGGAGNRKLHHTWSEGIQACTARTQSKTVIGQRLGIVQQTGTDSSQGVGITKYKAVITATKTFVFMSINTSTPVLDTTSIVTSAYASDTISNTTSASTSLVAQECVNLFQNTVQILSFCLLL